ncbi:transposon Tf2-9 polyprotein [Nephila pilipes]|uniref:Transposon Tf2-9 polyprotein n=1 Tax=Nephila pilipes TaxID=299642 RepID=A0A8X6J6Z5_NEPPI|nr:transposon Tf2-9 polyprotein [Nephila pilipes]
MCERTSALGVPKTITDTCTKFNYIVSHLLPEAAAIVRDIIITPDETDPYSAIKTQLIQRSGESSQQEIRKLLTGEELGDKKPSELLRIMNQRAASRNQMIEIKVESKYIVS